MAFSPDVAPELDRLVIAYYGENGKHVDFCRYCEAGLFRWKKPKPRFISLTAKHGADRTDKLFSWDYLPSRKIEEDHGN